MANEAMIGFGYKTAWLAVRDGDADAVLGHLGGQVVGPITWRDGVRQAYDREDTVIVTPLLDGWLLVAGWWIAASHEKLDTAALSRTLGREVHLFVTHRVVELHRWERAVNGLIVRSFEYIGDQGEVTRWSGITDVVERAIGLPPSYELGSDDVDVLINERDVRRVAAAWSIDPTSLDGQPAPGPLTVARLPAAPTRKPPRVTAVDVTDLIMADIPHDRRQRLIARRLRRRRLQLALDGVAGLFKRRRP